MEEKKHSSLYSKRGQGTGHVTCSHMGKTDWSGGEGDGNQDKSSGFMEGIGVRQDKQV